MGKTWNPDAPAVLGFQGEPTGGADSGIQAYIVRDLLMDSTQGETVTAIMLPINDNFANNNGRPSTWIEIFEDGDQFEGALDNYTVGWTSHKFQPNADGAGSQIGANDWNGQPGSFTTNLWSAIDETPLVWPPANLGDTIATASGPDIYRFHVNSNSFPAARRIIRMGINITLGVLDTGIGQYSNRNFNVAIRRTSDGAVRYPLQGIQLWATGYTTYFRIDLGEVNPFTGLPWTSTDIKGFDTVAPLYTIQVEGVGTTGAWALIVGAELSVTSQPENRVAVGLWARPDGQGPGYITTTALATMPGGAANWSKLNALRYCYRWRIPNDLFVVNPVSWPSTSWRTCVVRVDPLIASEGMPHNTKAQVVSCDPNGIPLEVVDSDAVPGLLLVVAGAASTDSNPYHGNPTANVNQANSGLQQMQRFTPGANGSYLGVQFIVRPTSASDAHTLTVTVHRVSDGVQMGGSLVLTAAQIRSLPAIEASPTYHKVQAFLSSAAALISGTQYEIRLTPSFGTWQFPRSFATNEGDISFGGTSNCRAERTNPGGVVTTFPDEDLGIVLLQEPPAMQSVAAQVEASPTRLGVSCFCEVDAVENVVVTWVNNSVPSFARIEIERYVDTGDYLTDAWVSVAWKLSSPLAVDAKWTDREVPRGTPVKYRLRNINTVGAWSQWVETDFVVAHARGCEIIFTSNEQPDLTLVYNHEPRVAYDLLGFDEDVLMPVDGADYQMAFVAAEDRGIGDRRRIIANFGRQPCDDLGRPIGKRRIFKPLRDAVRRVGIPYVCVLDSDGNRTFAHVELANAESDEPGWRYHVDATVTPIAGVATRVIVP